MAETEVESILREIRERVLTEQRSAQASAAITVASAGNGANESDARPANLPDNQSLTDDKLALFESYLTTTARTWDRLPPLVSNRSGSVARLELWVKRQLKQATRWFTWEQVNFNASVHQALRELPPILSANRLADHADRLAHQQELARLREQIKEALQVANAQQQTQLLAQRAELEVQQRAFEEQKILVAARFADLVSELHERVMHLEEEQRVSFKQLSLETSEAATLEDRASRRTDTLLKELQRRIEQLESRK